VFDLDGRKAPDSISIKTNATKRIRLFTLENSFMFPPHGLGFARFGLSKRYIHYINLSIKKRWLCFLSRGLAPLTSAFNIGRVFHSEIATALTWTTVQVGDVNGDGLADVLVGVPFVLPLESPPSWFSGSVSVFFGSRTLGGIVSQPDVVIAGLPVPNPFNPLSQITLGDHLGEALAVGDFNGDGFPDILAGAPGDTSNEFNQIVPTARAYVFLGSRELKSGARIETARFEQDITIGFGGSQVGSGDFNGDGVQDIVASDGRAARVYYGAPLSAPEIDAASYDQGRSELIIQGAGFTGMARVKVNGELLDREIQFDPNNYKLPLHGSPAELNLHAGKNKIIVLRKEARSNVVKIRL
jgi:FG-GAP repeat